MRPNEPLGHRWEPNAKLPLRRHLHPHQKSRRMMSLWLGLRETRRQEKILHLRSGSGSKKKRGYVNCVPVDFPISPSLDDISPILISEKKSFRTFLPCMKKDVLSASLTAVERHLKISRPILPIGVVFTGRELLTSTSRNGGRISMSMENGLKGTLSG